MIRQLWPWLAESRFPVPTQTFPFSTHSPRSRCVCVRAWRVFVGDRGGPSFILYFPRALASHPPKLSSLLHCPLFFSSILCWLLVEGLKNAGRAFNWCAAVLPGVSHLSLPPWWNMHWRSRPLPLSHSAAHNTPSFSTPAFKDQADFNYSGR